MLPILQQVAKEYKQKLTLLYGNDLVELILFGSYARGNTHDEPDVDFAIVLRNPSVRAASEIFKTSVITAALSLKYGIAISSLPVSLQKKQNSLQDIYREIRSEGITV